MILHLIFTDHSIFPHLHWYFRWPKCYNKQFRQMPVICATRLRSAISYAHISSLVVYLRVVVSTPVAKSANNAAASANVGTDAQKLGNQEGQIVYNVLESIQHSLFWNLCQMWMKVSFKMRSIHIWHILATVQYRNVYRTATFAVLQSSCYQW